MHIERHIFGSYRGYTTLACSPGVSADDCRILESSVYSFGQTYDARFNRTLAKTPAFFTRVLREDRRALARVLGGALDDNDRPTLLVVTVIVSQQDWDSQLCGDVQLLLEEERLWQWDGSAKPAAMEVTFRPPSHSVPRRTVPRVLALLSEIEHGRAAHLGVVVSASEFSQQEIACLEMLVPPSARAEFTSAYRTLSPQLAATVNCLAAEAGSQDRVTFRFQANHTPLSPYAEYLLESGFASGSIPLENIMAYNRFGMPPAQTTSGAEETPAPRVPITVVQRAQAWPVVAVALVAVILSVAAFVGAQLLSGNQTRDIQAQVDGMRGDNKHLADDLAALKHDLEKSRTATTPSAPATRPQPMPNPVGPSIAKETDELRKEVVRVSRDVESTRKQVDDLREMLRKQQAARFGRLDGETKRLIDKAKDKDRGTLGQNAGDLKWLYAEARGIDAGMLDSKDADALRHRTKEIEGLLCIVDTEGPTAEWERKRASVKTEDDKKSVAKEIGEKVEQALTVLDLKVKEMEGESVSAGLKKRLEDLRQWVKDNRHDDVKLMTATNPSK